MGLPLVEASLLKRQRVLRESVSAEGVRSALETEIALTVAVTLELVR